ncbi:phosphoadenosine phosphosulfate reductase [Pseudaestuariivita sp.]|uniref:phosphoadenosine phosphosulfate reductase n=1 Tax=Pseudaestuariivita sp. TaxID=2211669 RepID=UPI00405A2548
MQDQADIFDTPMQGLNLADWTAALTQIASEHGFFQDLGPKHMSTYVDRGNVLLVTFETRQGIQALSDSGQPLGFELVREMDWSHLCVVSEGDTWFRDPAVYEYFDNLTDDGFFDEFESVLFYGAGPCGYAACAFSVSTPGAKVVAVQPQATLDPQDAGWDDRFTEMRRTDFTSRYGFAPDMLEAAHQVHLIHDPFVQLDAMHAALFRAPNVTQLRMPLMGEALQSDLLEMEQLFDVLSLACKERLTPARFAKRLRARREHRPYLRALLSRLDRDDRPGLARLLCRNVIARMPAPQFERRLEALDAAATQDA